MRNGLHFSYRPIYSFDTCPVSPIRNEDTEHYHLYRDFMAAPQEFLPKE